MDFPIGMIAGMRVNPALMNGAGTCKNVHDVYELARSPAGAITIGSYTEPQRDGNQGKVDILDQKDFALNSWGIPNFGLARLTQEASEMVRIAHDHNKPIVCSIAGGFSEKGDHIRLAAVAVKAGVDSVELNAGCPNICDGGKQKRIPCFYPELLAEMIYEIRQEIGMQADIRIKLSSYSNPEDIPPVAQVINESGASAIVLINTFANAMEFDIYGKPAIDANGGRAGLSGPPLKRIALGQVHQFRALLKPEVQIVGMGGVSDGKDFIDMLNAGANIVAMATRCLTSQGKLNAKAFEHLLHHYCDIVEAYPHLQ